MLLGRYPIADVPFSGQDADILVTYPEQVIYAATNAFTTEPDDAPDNLYIESRLKTPLVFERSIMDGNGVGAAASVGFGSIELENIDGFYDLIVSTHSIDGRRVTLKLGDPRPDFAYEDFGIIFDGAASGWVPNEKTIKVMLRDWSYKLEVPIAKSYYGGTGGLDGTAELAGKPIPQCFGNCKNITLTLVDPTNLVYQAHDGQIKAVTAVRDRGVALTAGVNYTVNLANGCITLLQNPAGIITADVQGSNLGSVYVETTADIIERILVGSAGWSTSNYKASSFAAMNAEQPAPVNYFVSQDVTISNVIDDLLGGIGGYRDFTRDGYLEVGIVSLPSGEITGIYSEVEIQSIQRLDPPSTFYPPTWRHRVGYERNWTVQETDLAGSVSTTDRAFLSQEYRYGSAQDSGIKASFLLAQDAEPRRSYFDLKADADAEALRLLALYAVPRSFYSFVVKTQPFTANIGDVVMGIYPRFELKLGASMRVLSVRDDAPNDQITLKAFL